MHEVKAVPTIELMRISSNQRSKGRPEDIPESTQMRRVSRLYYLEDKSRQQIADLENLDPRRVSWLLRQALLLGVVRIDIREPAEEELAARLQRRFPHLQKVLITSGGTQVETKKQCDELFRRFAILAADYFEQLYEHHPRGKPLHVGVTGGLRILEFVNAVQERPREEIVVHPTGLIGHGPEHDASYIDPILTASILWSRCGSFPGQCQYATVSPYDTSGPGRTALEAVAKEFELLRKNSVVKKAIRDMDKLDVVLGGLAPTELEGTIPTELRSRMTMTGLLQSIITPKQLRSDGAVGDFSYCAFDEDGNGKKDKDGSDLWRFFMTPGYFSTSTGIEFFKQMVKKGKRVVAFGGPYLLKPTKAALKGEVFNVWITDEHTARQIAEGT
jgi:DNA-binding transcriptional regulator LsrR (DeoR family)